MDIGKAAFNGNAAAGADDTCNRVLTWLLIGAALFGAFMLMRAGRAVGGIAIGLFWMWFWTHGAWRWFF